MKRFIPTSLVLVLGLAASAAARDLSSAERAALAGLPASDIATLRAGAADAVPSVSSSERLALGRAEEAAGDLDELRAIDDHDLEVVAVVLGIVILAILIF